MREAKHDNSEPEAHELTAAVEDIVFRLAHDLSDTPEDIRDAVAFAPLGLVKFLHHVATQARRRPRVAIALVTATVAGMGLLTASLCRRSLKP